jgi:putative flippase GtrA
VSQLVLYCICGGLGVGTDYATYWLLVTGGVGYQVANVAGYLAGTVLSFFLNRRITFGVRTQMMRRLAIFLGVAAVGFSVSAALLWLLVHVMAMDARIAKLLTLPVVVLIQYTLNRRITFNETPRQSPA